MIIIYELNNRSLISVGYNGNVAPDGKEFCAGLPADGGLIPGARTICKGDSGGALICDIDGYITFAGVLSRQTPFEDNCGVEGHPGVFTDLFYFTEWILEMVTPEFYGLTSVFESSKWQLHTSGNFFYLVPNFSAFQDSITYDNAYDFCEENGNAKLPVPQSDEENEQIAQLLPGKTIWLGVSSGAQSTGYENYWTSDYEVEPWGETSREPSSLMKFTYELTYTNWRSGDGLPAGLSGNDNTNAVIDPSDGADTWVTADADELHNVVCIYKF